MIKMKVCPAGHKYLPGGGCYECYAIKQRDKYRDMPQDERKALNDRRVTARRGKAQAAKA